jgi:glycosyltransferase involved in cell wall biosynthesis
MRDTCPKISVVVTCYNYGRYVAGCLRSIQQQTFTDYEVIVVDDGSTDDSREQIRGFLHDERFKLITQKNGGQANAKNRGIRESCGEFIAFLDADDLWAPEKLEKQIGLFTQKGVGVVFSDVDWIDENGEIIGRGGIGTYLQQRRGKVVDFLIYDNFVPFSSVLVRKECFDAMGVFDETLAMGIDWDLWLRFSTRYTFDYCDEKLLLYRVGHSGQMSKNMMERLQCADRIIAKFTRLFPDTIAEDVLEDARYYSCCVRGYALRQYGFRYSLKYYFQAIRLFPCRKQAYIGLLKASLRTLFKL